jgi:hypothetical protein
MNFIFILIITLVVLYLQQDKLIEKFNAYQTFQSFIPLNTNKFPRYPLVNPAYTPYWYRFYIPWSNGYTDLPWWNTSLGNTTNMSYDLRGDPLIIPRTNFVWNNGTNFPINNQSV